MTKTIKPRIPSLTLSNGESYAIDARPDVGDRRDLIYAPTLAALKASVDIRDSDWWNSERVRDQESDPSCTGHALASIIDHLYSRDVQSGRVDAKVPEKPHFSARMLYNVGRFHDEWQGEEYKGSSIRGVLKGFYYNGVCTLDAVRELLAQNGYKKKGFLGWHMTREILKSAQSVQLGAYFRVRHRLADLQAALNEADLVLVSADIHKGWQSPGKQIPFDPGSTTKLGRHAFVIIGYSSKGLLVQNSWSTEWADGGVAIWTYEDWAANVLDMWVLRLTAPFENELSRRLPQMATRRNFDTSSAGVPFGSLARDLAPKRLDVLGHLVPLNRGRVDYQGRYNADKRTLRETAIIVREGRDASGDYRYKHLLIHFMGIQSNEEHAVAAICNTLPVYRKNGIYPVFVMIENALSREIHALCRQIVQAANHRVGDAISPEKDEQIEGELSLVALRLLEQIEESALKTFRCVSEKQGKPVVEVGEGAWMLQQIFKAQAKRHRAGNLNYHLSAHGFGACVIAAMLQNESLFDTRPVISNINLFAPILRKSRFEHEILPLLKFKDEGRINRRTRREEMVIESLRLIVLNESAHRIDHPFSGYGCSWPQLWAHCSAIAAPKEEYDAGDILKTDYSPYEQERDTLKILALPSTARDVVTRASDEREMSLLSLSPDERGQTSYDIWLKEPKHRDLDMRIDMLDFQLKTITGTKTLHTFSEFYPDRSSLMDS